MSLTTKYRPQNWETIVGQDHITKILQNSVITKQLHNSYLFVGLMGSGKTTTARVLAKSLVCQNLQANAEPCNECSACIAVTNGTSLDVKELDMATNRGIDDVRVLKEFAVYASSGGKHRIFICDEAHQLTPQAASALLKILEEPPKDVVFILCTTELNKILPTIRSRCQVHAFKRIAEDVIVNRLVAICEAEALTLVEDGTLLAIAKAADGSMRNAESMLANLISGGNVSISAFKSSIGVSGVAVYKNLFKDIQSNNVIEVVREFKRISEDIGDSGKWAGDFAVFIFNEMIANEKQWRIYVPYLNIVEQYLVQIYQNQPIVFLEAMLFKMASIQQEESHFVEVRIGSTTSDIWDLARWFDAISICQSHEGFVMLDKERIEINIFKEKIEGKNPYILFSSIEQILKLPQDIDKNELVEKGLIVLE